MEDDRTTALESQLGQAKQIAEEADKKYEEVRNARLKETQYIFERNGHPFITFALRGRSKVGL